MIGRALRLALGGLRKRTHAPAGLTELAQRFGTDKWSKYHRYTGHYERHLARLRDRPITLLEIGVGGYHHEEYGGASLRMWKAFFPRARIVGIDIEDKSIFEEERIRIFRGSQVDPEFLRRVLDEIDVPTVVIDDGSHVNAHVLRSFEILFPVLPMGAVYAIEDTQTAYWPHFGGRPPGAAGPRTTMDLVKERIDGLNHSEYSRFGCAPTALDREIGSVHCYHNLVFFEKAVNDTPSVSETFKIERMP